MLTSCCCNTACARILFSDLCSDRDYVVTSGGITYPIVTTIGGKPATALLASGTYHWVAEAPNDCMEDEEGDVTITCPQGNATVTVPITPITGWISSDETYACPCCHIGPECIEMTVIHPEANGGMFQDATITWQAMPAGLDALGLGSYGWLSDEFEDGDTGDMFRYYIYCFNGTILLTRLYEESFWGSPYRDVIRYTWDPADDCEIGSPPSYEQNTCCPFHYYCGTIFAGGDAATIVKLDGC